jgi:dihydropteroate synthase
MLMKNLNFSSPVLMGIVNITPDSFFDGGIFIQADKAYQHIQQLIDDGADIIDLGAASSRPGFEPTNCDEELDRLDPIFSRLNKSIKVPISIDTDKPKVAKEALSVGASIINNTGEPSEEMAELAAKYGAYLIIMYKGPLLSADIIDEIKTFFKKAICQAVSAGLPRYKIILDPGIGFNMDANQCVEVIRHLDCLSSLELPLLVGMSNKRFIGAVSGATLDNRGPANIGAEICAIEKGASILRVHDIAASRQALNTYLTLKEKS